MSASCVRFCLLPATIELEGYYAFSRVCFSVYLLAGLLIKLWMDMEETYTNGSLCNKEQLIRFW